MATDFQGAPAMYAIQHTLNIDAKYMNICFQKVRSGYITVEHTRL